MNLFNSSHTEAERRTLISERQKTSAFWAIVHLLGSLKLAMFLLFTITVAIATATVTESRFDTAVARHYFYRAPWFSGWLIVLCLNLACAALTRWPWQRKHLGFVVTHIGIITLLIGAMVGRVGGFEAFVTLHKDIPQRRLIVQESILTVQSARDGGLDRLPFPVEIDPPSPKNPRRLPLPDTNLRLLVDNYTEQLMEVKNIVPSTVADAPAGVGLEFHTQMMGQTVPVGLLLQPEAASTFDFFGLARVNWVKTLPVAVDNKKPAAPKPFILETHVVLAASPDQPVIHSDQKPPTGYRVYLGAENAEELQTNPHAPVKFIVIAHTPSGDEQSWPLELAKGKKITLRDGKSQMFVADFWPDFSMRDGKPITLSPNPNNPAILVHLQIAPTAAQTAPARPTLTLAPLGKDQIAYQIAKPGKPLVQGTAKVGDAFALGWADWQARVKAIEPQAEIQRVFLPPPATDANGQSTPTANQAPMGMNGAALPGIHARLVAPDGRESESRWIVSGSSQALVLGKEVIRVGFGLKPITLPFSITLEKFEVPRDEGTTTPSNFISSLRFDDPSMGAPRQDVAQMNYPAMHPGSFWRSLLGWNYKFSQAQWNPDDLDETTLQVLYDPGWPFKWTGSLMICLGIAVMFYFKAPAKKKMT